MKFLIAFLICSAAFAQSSIEDDIRQALAGVRCDMLEEDSGTYSKACLREVKIAESETVNLPLGIFDNFELIKEADRERCKVGSKIEAKHVPTGKVYTVYYTDEDHCDGGNSYGIMVRGRTPRTDRVVRVMSDVTFYPPEKSE